MALDFINNIFANNFIQIELLANGKTMSTKQEIKKHLTKKLAGLENQTMLDGDEIIEISQELERDNITRFTFENRGSDTDSWIQAEAGGNIYIDGRAKYIGIVFEFDVRLDDLYGIEDATKIIMRYNKEAKKILEKLQD